MDKTPIPWYKSELIWFNLVTGLALFLDQVLKATEVTVLLSPKAIAVIGGVLAVVNIILRVYTVTRAIK